MDLRIGAGSEQGSNLLTRLFWKFNNDNLSPPSNPGFSSIANENLQVTMNTIDPGLR